MRKIFISIWFLICYVHSSQPDFIYLAWEGDPTSTATIYWAGKESSSNAKIGMSEETLKSQVANFQELEGGFVLYSLILNDLQPETEYLFQMEGDENNYRFQTMPKELTKTRFVVGGDAFQHSNLFREMNRQIVSQKPDFIVIGGDIAYSYKNNKDGVEKQLGRWKGFFTEWHRESGLKTGKLIPFIAVVGNHDVHSGTKDKEKINQELFYAFFKGNSYRKYSFGNYLSLLVLDSGHNATVDGLQTSWLEETLKKDQEIPYKLSVYHVSAYPSVYPFSGKRPKAIREYWVPLFEKHQLQVAFENHNHAYKRTKTLRNGKAQDKGVVYVGDGSWGVPIRTPNSPKKLPYLEKSFSRNAVCLVTLTKEQGLVEAMDNEGEIFDSFTFKPN